MTHRPATLAPALLAVGLSFALTLTAVRPSQGQDGPATPFDAVVSGSDTVIRAGGSRAHYEVGKLEVGTQVRVDSELFGWYVIPAPEGVFCFVERKNVNVRGDGSLGVVETDGTLIYVAHVTKGPADSYRNVMSLDAGDTVEIVDEVSNAYKIKPPKGTFVFLPPGSIAPAGDAPAPAPEPVTPVAAEPEVVTPEEPVVVAPPADPTPEPVVVNPPAPVEPEPVVAPEPTPEPAPAVAEVTSTPAEEISFDSAVDEPAAAPVVVEPIDLLNDPMVEVPLPDVAVETQASNEMLRAVEVAMLPYLSLPVDEQPIAKMVRGYADAAQIAQLSDNDMAIVRARLTQIERNRELALALAEAEAVTAEVNDGQAPETPDPLADAETPTEGEAEAEGEAVAEASTPEDAGDAEASAAAESAPPAPSVPAVASEYDAVGILTASTVHTGANQPKLLRLLDPTGRRTVAYLEPNDAIDTVQMIGRIVGIVGESVYDPTTRLNLIRPTRVDVLSAN
ncbi:MAG: hypothetical protein AAF593_05830 [Planctomycetota bacterium]